MIEITGDMFSQKCDAICITTNAIVSHYSKENVMGAGCALEAKNRWPIISLILGNIMSKRGNRVHVLTQESDRNEKFLVGTNIVVRYHICSFPTKAHWKFKADIDLITKSADQLVKVANHMKWKNIVIPRPGCGLGGLQWPQVRAVLAQVWDDRFKVITR